MSELTTEQLIKIIIGVLVVVAVVIGVFLFFRYKVIDFFKGYTDEKPQGTENQTGGTENITEAKSYKIGQVGFKVGDNFFFNREVIKTGTVRFIVDSESNCERTEYQVWEENTVKVENWFRGDWTAYVGDIKKSDRINLAGVDNLLNSLPKGKYHVDCYCFDSKGKSTKIISKNLEIK